MDNYISIAGTPYSLRSDLVKNSQKKTGGRSSRGGATKEIREAEVIKKRCCNDCLKSYNCTKMTQKQSGITITPNKYGFTDVYVPKPVRRSPSFADLVRFEYREEAKMIKRVVSRLDAAKATKNSEQLAEFISDQEILCKACKCTRVEKIMAIESAEKIPG